MGEAKEKVAEYIILVKWQGTIILTSRRVFFSFTREQKRVLMNMKVGNGYIGGNTSPPGFHINQQSVKAVPSMNLVSDI